MRAARRDRVLSDDEWAPIAHDVMNRTGLSPDGQEDDAVRWIAVRHGDDHIHIVAMLARQDRRRPACPTNGATCGRRAWPPRNATGWSPPRPLTGPRPAVPPAPRPPRPPAAAWTSSRDHAAPPRHHRRRRCAQRAGVLRPPRPRRGAGPPAVQREEPRPGHRVRGRPARRHGQRRRPGLVRRRQARPRPELAQAAPPVDATGSRPVLAG